MSVRGNQPRSTQTPAAPALKKSAAAPAMTTPKPGQATPVRTDRFDAVAAVQVERAGAQGTTVKFAGNWGESVTGEVKAGGKLTIEYDPERAQIRHTHNGFPAWGITAFVKFQPTGDVVERPAIQFESFYGRPTNNALCAPFTVDVPINATQVEVWFRNWTGADSPRESWDSDYGKNYKFNVKD